MTDILTEGRALAESYNREGNGFANTGKKNAYECEKCHAYIVTIDRAPGVAPFMTKCGNCGGMAQSKCYRVADRLEPTHEWYRPDSLDGIAAGYHEHLSRGGLILRSINGAGWTTGDPVKHPVDEASYAARLDLIINQIEAEERAMTRQQMRHAKRKNRDAPAEITMFGHRYRRID